LNYNYPYYLVPWNPYYYYPNYQYNYNNTPNKRNDFFNLGDPAPDFTLPAIVNGNESEVTLSDYLGKWVLIFFYGSDFTFV